MIIFFKLLIPYIVLLLLLLQTEEMTYVISLTNEQLWVTFDFAIQVKVLCLQQQQQIKEKVFQSNCR